MAVKNGKIIMNIKINLMKNEFNKKERSVRNLTNR